MPPRDNPGLPLHRHDQELFISVPLCSCFKAPAVSVISWNPHVLPVREVGQVFFFFFYHRGAAEETEAPRGDRTQPRSHG